MSTFLRLLSEKNKAEALMAMCNRLRDGEDDPRVFEVDVESFNSIPGRPFAYWAGEVLRGAFSRLPAFEGAGRTTKQGLATADDFRFIRLWWECGGPGWFGFAKGGAFSPFYADIHLLVNWSANGAQIKHNLNERGAVRSNVWMLRDTANRYFLRPGLTWPRRTNGLSFRVMPKSCIFADKGPAAFIEDDAPDALLALCALANSSAFGSLVSVQLARVELAQSFEVGLIQQTPIPNVSAHFQARLADLARRAWSLKRTLDSVDETSHAFLLPSALIVRLKKFDPPSIQRELAEIEAEIDSIAFALYGIPERSRSWLPPAEEMGGGDSEFSADEQEEDYTHEPADHSSGLISWAVGVAFGRFDWRLATCERSEPAEPDPFAQLPNKSSGMLADAAVDFHDNAGILVDDRGHPCDLASIVEEILAVVDVTVPGDVRRWLCRDFFACHLQRYSKTRRRAPIYWQLASAFGAYTLWVYYPRLSNQTLYSAINDFIEPKLKQVGAELASLTTKGGARTREDEKSLEMLQSVELELVELRDTLLTLAPNYKPHHDDGVQINAAPLWPLFRHKSWQKVLKETWEKLERGDYDWAHLAMNYWPERVREKCKTDKSLAIAHGLEHLYIEPEDKPNKKTHARKKGAGDA
jgi:hypothetical protein